LKLAKRGQSSVVYPLIFIFLIACTKPVKVENYRVNKKAIGNFSVISPEIQPYERMVVRVNDDVIWDAQGKGPLGKPGAWRYYKYPRKIKKIQFIDYYNSVIKLSKEFKDTLVKIPQRTLIISRSFPKHSNKSHLRKRGFVSIDTGKRLIILVNDAVYFKGTWTDEVK